VVNAAGTRSYRNNTKSYDGSTWTSSPGSLNTARQNLNGSGAGTQTAGLAFGGNIPTVNTGATEEYNGSKLDFKSNKFYEYSKSYTLAGWWNSNCCIRQLVVMTTGCPTDATEEYDGSNWTAVASLATARHAISRIKSRISQHHL
jgi:hypothetical protein